MTITLLLFSIFPFFPLRFEKFSCNKTGKITHYSNATTNQSILIRIIFTTQHPSITASKHHSIPIVIVSISNGLFPSSLLVSITFQYFHTIPSFFNSLFINFIVHFYQSEANQFLIILQHIKVVWVHWCSILQKVWFLLITVYCWKVANVV